MKKTFISLLAALFTAFLLAGCKKTNNAIVNKNKLSADEISLIKAAGFQSTGAVKMEEGYLIEGDILLTADELRSFVGNNEPGLIVANSEHYRTTNRVTGLPRTLTIRWVGNNINGKNAMVDAINRYNTFRDNHGFRIRFLRVSYTDDKADITISENATQPTIANADLPTRNGNPGAGIRFNPNLAANVEAKTLITVIAHEIGHCIGFRHTDYLDNSFSCGEDAYTESSNAGFVHIPGTPKEADSASWMLACIPNGVNRPFNANDRIALRWMY